MAKHSRENRQESAPAPDERRRRLSESAARSSALLANRAAGRKSQTEQEMRSAQQQQAARSMQQQARRSAQQSKQSAKTAKTARPAQAKNARSLGQFIRRNAVYIVSTIVVILVVTAGVFGAKAILGLSDSNAESASSSSSEADPDLTDEIAYTSPYDWTKLEWADGRYRYVVDGQVKSRLGVDVSNHDGDIDWEAVAADGIDFAIIRLGYRGATEGGLYLDGRYQQNMQDAADAGLDRGVYFFSQARTVEEALEEADFVLKNLGGANLSYPVVYDHEESVGGVERTRADGVGDDDMTAAMEAFCERVEGAGYRTLVYGNAHDLSRYRYASLKQHAIWWAEYDVPRPTAQIDFTIWQFTSSGQVDGISKAADLNIDLSGALE